ncbi:DUF302 domain-containing protein [Mycobacterium sp. OTB74]|jgi:hypothetical protein|uniref:DUF302 domain-containing protein n=1 Tax=Mycobacterium sp. OTB74 TaxID=1853452 RepID=UPI0024741A8D|nr:DUF302 domain-containing protein [Mycobacterium sp. OTB74]MDH6244075.1 hypothetical protein [Mycobacterium sp. OTB74]
MNAVTTAIDHPSRRLVVPLPESYEEARAHYETLVPEVDNAQFREMSTWHDVVDLAKILAPHGFMRYARIDLADLMAKSRAPWQATQYLMGNHTIAERMYRYDPSIMLHAPLRSLLYTDDRGIATFAVDQPSLLFASYQSPDIAAVGHELDDLLAELIKLLGGAVPDQLLNRTD